MTTVEALQVFFAVLALVALAGAVVIAVGAAAGQTRAGRPAWLALRGALAPSALGLAWLVAAVTTAGSLYFSEVAGYIPCLLCWYQRILAYPLVVIVGVAALRRDTSVWMMALPFTVIGMAVSGYHYATERFPALDSGACVAAGGPSCAVPYFEVFGFVTLAFMAFCAFAAITALVLLARAGSADVDVTDDAEEWPEEPAEPAEGSGGDASRALDGAADDGSRGHPATVAGSMPSEASPTT